MIGHKAKHNNCDVITNGVFIELTQEITPIRIVTENRFAVIAAVINMIVPASSEIT